MNRLLPLLVAFSMGVSAAELLPIPEQQLLLRREAPTVDGRLDDWDLAAAAVLDPETAPPDQLRSNDPANPFTGSSDLTARVLVGWDAAYLYLAGQVRDDHLVGIKPVNDHNVGPAGWFVDAVMVQLRSFRQPLVSNTPYDRQPFLCLRYVVPADGRGQLLANSRGVLDRADNYWKLPRGSRLACIETPEGYQVEAAVPWASLGFVPRVGEPLQLAALIADTDPGEALNQLGWQFPVDQYAFTYRLATDPRTVATLSLARDEAPAGTVQTVRVTVDAVGAPVRVEAVTFEIDGEDVARIDLGLDVPQGRRLDHVAVIRDLPATPGTVTARLLATVAGEEMVLAGSQFELLPPQAPPPLVVNPPGELRRMSPGRTAHHARELVRLGELRHGWITDRSGYERYLLTHVKDSIDSRVPQMIAAKEGKWAGNYVLSAYALLQLTGEDKYAEYVRACIGLQMDWLKEATGEERAHRMVSLIWPRWFLWQETPETPLAPPNVEQEYAELWAELAAAPPPIFFSERGWHNRCYHRWAWCRMASHFADQLGKTVDPRILEYIAWHEERLISIGDATDNSSNYLWTWVQYPQLVHAMEGTLDQYWAHPGYSAVAERYRHYFSPGGALPNWGSGNGWGTGLGEGIRSIALWARLSGDGRFSWTAHRIAEYLYNNLYDNHDQYHQVKDSVNWGIAFAWLMSEDAPAPRAATHRSYVTFGPEVSYLTPDEREGIPGIGWQKLTERQVPDKLVLQSSNDPWGLWAFVELRVQSGHAGVLPGNVMAMLRHESVLYGGQGYYELTQDFNNVVWVEDLEGAASDPRATTLEVPLMVEDDRFTWVRLNIERYGGLPITAVRDLIFVKNGCLILRDKLTFHGTMKVRVGPCWNTRSLGPQAGDDWFNTYYENVYLTGLGLGRGVHEWDNPPMDLMVVFSQRDDCRLSVADRYDDNPWRVSPVRLRQYWSGIVEDGDQRTFTTILVPHLPAMNVVPYREKIDILVDTEETLVARVPMYSQAVREHYVGDPVTVQLHEGEGVVESGDWASDGRFAFVQRRQNGQLVRAALVDGQILNEGGEDLAGAVIRPAPERIFVLDDAN